ncbi:hypothetical protein CWB73_00415 [Pseudoalteromonas phenolica]|uniref:Uncharacterized protein n=1 Tax=Pseudoalteromonas phenolica TaxID=161398 RepID=A0A5S3Z0P1_9GAMM|nr:hypothetical protein [Pseudoalteromonas phenolica]TMP84165.1 hypothetical protein CWB73_00415 [Pseudoalteromonas phenolica]
MSREAFIQKLAEQQAENDNRIFPDSGDYLVAELIAQQHESAHMGFGHDSFYLVSPVGIVEVECRD